MGIWKAVKRWFQRSSSQPPPKLIRMRYDAAVTDAENRRHWANADSLSANAANSPEVRRTLRNRARYEVANNSYAKGIVLTLANDLIGTGPHLQCLTPDPKFNRFIEREFQAWMNEVRLAEKLRTLHAARITDGEGFAILVNNPRLGTPVKLDIRLVEADQVTTPDLTLWTADNIVDGIVFDEFGNPVEYHVLKQHPGDMGWAWKKLWEYERIPASSMLHWFRCDRPGQGRGIPDITPALPLFAQLRRFTLAVIAAAETAANFAGILYTDAPAGGEAEAAEPFEPIELEQRALLTMPSGWKMSQLQAEQPSTTYAEFKREILNEIARCLNLPFNVAAGNSSSYNYASGRLDHQTYFKSIDVERHQLEITVLDRILESWFDEAALIFGYLPFPSVPGLEHQWFWDGREHVDPIKEAQAQTMRLANHTTTLAYEYAKIGLDWEEALRQRAKELALMQELGLSITSASTPANESPKSEEEEDYGELQESKGE